jgi:prophage regulatory protein
LHNATLEFLGKDTTNSGLTSEEVAPIMVCGNLVQEVTTCPRPRARKITEILTEAREPAAPIDQVLSTRQVVEITGKHRVTIYRWIRAGIFPEKHESRGHKVGWLRSEIEAWLQRSPPAS